MDKSIPESQDRDFSAFQSPHEASIDRLVKTLDRAYHRPWLMLWRSFWQGLMTALGMSIGYIIIVFILLFTLNKLGGIDLLRPTLLKLQDMIIPKSIQNGLNSLPNQGTSPSTNSVTFTNQQLQQLLKNSAQNKP